MNRARLASSQQGIILLSVLLFLIIMALLSLTALESAQLHWQMTRNFNQRIYQLAVLETTLSYAEQQLTKPQAIHCLHAISRQQMPWLLHPFCQWELAGVTSAYVVELLATPAGVCVQTRSAEGQEISVQAVFYRITTWLLPGSPHLFLQTIFVTENRERCNSRGIVVKLGRSSWRELDE